MVIYRGAPMGGKVMVARRYGFGLVVVAMEPWGLR